MNEKGSHRGLKRMIEVGVVIFVLVAFTSLLMPSLQKARTLSHKAVQEMRDYEYQSSVDSLADKAAKERPVARGEVRRFKADVDLTSRISIGTAYPESIYEAKFTADILARNPEAATGDAEIRLPLPPQLISLSDLKVTVAGDPSENVFVDGSSLVWRGPLDTGAPVPINVTYTAVGKGLYELQVPPGKILETFDVTLTANSSDLRMMELSLQPEPPRREAGKIIYQWHYDRLMLGRPIRIDILGIAPMDRLGELVRLGPFSVLVFGLLAAMVALAYHPEALDKWMLLLIVGSFAAAYPLMYYAQDFVPLGTAIIGAGLAMMIIIGIRAVTLLGLRVGLMGIVLSGTGVLTLTMLATIYKQAQGILLTVLVVGALVGLMVLVPLARKQVASVEAPTVPEPPVTE